LQDVLACGRFTKVERSREGFVEHPAQCRHRGIGTDEAQRCPQSRRTVDVPVVEELVQRLAVEAGGVVELGKDA